MKLPTILYSKNSAAQPGAEFLIRTKPPLVVAQVLHFQTREDMEEFIRSGMNDRSITAYAYQYEGKVLTVYCGLLADHSYGVKSAQDIANELAAIIRRMSDWYYHNIFTK